MYVLVQEETEFEQYQRYIATNLFNAEAMYIQDRSQYNKLNFKKGDGLDTIEDRFSDVNIDRRIREKNNLITLVINNQLASQQYSEADDFKNVYRVIKATSRSNGLRLLEQLLSERLNQ